MPLMKFTGRHDSGKNGWQFVTPPPQKKKKKKKEKKETFLDLNLKSMTSLEIWRMFQHSFD